jgi:hypothetical protein
MASGAISGAPSAEGAVSALLTNGNGAGLV